MEIGLKIIRANNKISEKNLVLSIQIGLNGLSFLVLDLFSKNIEDYSYQTFKDKITPKVLLDKIIKQFELNKNLNQDFTKIQLIHDNELQTLVPSALFEEANLTDYIKYNAKIFKSDFVTYDSISNQDIMLVYVPFVNINNFIFDRFGSFEYKHSSTILIEKTLHLKKNIKDTTLYVNVESSIIDIIIVKSNSLLFYNRFQYKTKEDFIYFILFTIEQLDLNPEKLKCEFFGSINSTDELYLIAFKYIRNISILAFDKMNYYKKKNTENFIILNSFN